MARFCRRQSCYIWADALRSACSRGHGVVAISYPCTRGSITPHAVHATSDRIFHCDGRDWKHHSRVRASQHIATFDLDGDRAPGGGARNPAFRPPPCARAFAHFGWAAPAGRGEAAGRAGRVHLFGRQRGRRARPRATVAGLFHHACANGDAGAFAFVHVVLSGDAHHTDGRRP